MCEGSNGQINNLSGSSLDDGTIVLRAFIMHPLENLYSTSKRGCNWQEKICCRGFPHAIVGLYSAGVGKLTSMHIALLHGAWNFALCLVPFYTFYLRGGRKRERFLK